ncbi:MAG: hypothetical protein LUE90_05165 [Clostridiales bacterium]|nr:hypothetical protein [Clostridiales bacterium]
MSAALDRAIESCIADDVLRRFLREHRGEVKRVMTLDYTFERRLQLAKEENQEIIEQLVEEKAQLSNKNERLSIENEQLSTENEHLSTENEQLSTEKEHLLSEVERMRKLLEEHGIEEEKFKIL